MQDKAESPLIRLALPSKGQLEKDTLRFLASAGLGVARPNERQYVATIPHLPQVQVLFQRAIDVASKVNDGSVDMGITGYDIVREHSDGQHNIILAYENLGYGGCRLVVAVPKSWVDVSDIADIADLTVSYKERGQDFRIATKYPNLTKAWLHKRGIVYFSLVESQGALEAAPSMGYADIIVDLTSTGTTLRENQLKEVIGGTILESQACLIGNKHLLQHEPGKLKIVRTILEFIEARMKAKKYVTITANICGETPQAVATQLMKQQNLAGMQGPTITEVFPKSWSQDNWYAVDIVVEQAVLIDAVDNLRDAGGKDITIQSPRYMFDSRSRSYEFFLEKLKRTRH
jgi:ATP phosphoribosyltransferase